MAKQLVKCCRDSGRVSDKPAGGMVGGAGF